MHPSTGSGRTEAQFGDRLPRLCTLRQAQGERKRILGIVFPGCAPCDGLRANGSALWGSSSPAVCPSTGSGRTEAHFGDRLPRLCTLRRAQGERMRTLGIVFAGCAPFDRLRANGSAIWGVFPGCAPCDELRANGAHFGDRLSRQFTLDRLRANGSPLWDRSSR